MRVLCRHGHYSFYPRMSTDLGRFTQAFGITLEREEDYYTFEGLKEAPYYSLATLTYLNLPAIETFQGKPWEVMKKNGFVYNIELGLLVPKSTIFGIANITQRNFFYISDVPILQAGVRTSSGDDILSYSGEFYEDKFYLRILEFSDE